MVATSFQASRHQEASGHAESLTTTIPAALPRSRTIHIPSQSLPLHAHSLTLNVITLGCPNVSLETISSFRRLETDLFLQLPVVLDARPRLEHG